MHFSSNKVYSAIVDKQHYKHKPKLKLVSEILQLTDISENSPTDFAVT